MQSDIQSADRSPISLSIVIVTFNSNRWIKACLAGLAASVSGLKSQLFIIDNASTDGTAVFLRENNWSQSGFADVKVIFNTVNTGFTRAVNQGLRLSGGASVLLLNPDVVPVENTLPLLLQELYKNKVGVVAPQLRYPDGRVQPSCRRFPKKRDIIFELFCSGPLKFPSIDRLSWKMPDFDHSSSRDVDQPQGAFLLFPREVLQRVGYMDEIFPMFFSDVDWCKRVHGQGWRIRFCADAHAFHAKGDSITPKKLEMLVSSHRSFYRYFLKYDSGVQKVAAHFIGFILLLMLVPRFVAVKLNVQR